MTDSASGVGIGVRIIFLQVRYELCDERKPWGR
jgi:hypothetical protein